MNSATRELPPQLRLATPGWAARLTRDRILSRIAGLPCGQISIEDAEFEVDGDEVEIYPIDIDSPLGSITIGLYGKNENGVWRVTEIDGV